MADARAGEIDRAYGAFRGTRLFGSLDGLRAIAILLVVWQHAPGFAREGSWLTDAGATGVALFFALSGFLITTLLLREESRTGAIDLGKFYARRALRIFPLYYAVLGLYVVLVLVREHNAAGRLFFENLVYFATYTSNWFVDLRVNEDGQRRVLFVFAWSLATEEQFYLFWPVLLRWLRRRWAVGALVGVMGVDLAATFWWGRAGEGVGIGGRLLKIAQSPSTEIGLGVLGALVLHSRAGFGVAWRVLGGWWSVWGATGAAVAAAMWSREATPAWYLAQGVALALVVLSCVVREDHRLSGLLRVRPLARLGVISYGVYLLHPLSIHVARLIVGGLGIDPASGLGMPLTTAGTLAVVWVAAEVSFRVFESRFLGLKGRFAAGDRPRAGAGESRLAA